MINIEFENDFISESVLEILKQIDFLIITNENNSFATIKIVQKKDVILLLLDDKKISFKLPIEFQVLFQNIQNLLTNVVVAKESFNYFPFQSLIIKNNKKLLLTELQNKLFSSLVLNKQGIGKEDLYKLIWPNDRNLSFNKIETHMTNLKNYLKSELDLFIKIQSNNKLINLIIN